ncbi:MAG: ABC transporter permease [Patescibacteria group bacterium]
MNKELTAIITIAFRDLTKLMRDKFRIAANFVFPLIFIGVLGTSLQSNLQENLQYNFLTFVFTGVVAQTLFQSTAAGLISLIEDRQNDFAQELFISPISRYSIIIGKILGETMVAFVQITGVLIFGLFFNVPLDILTLVKLIPIGILIAFFGGAFGVIVMANFSDQRTANQIFPFLLFPQFFLAGVFNPIKVLPTPILILSRIAPLTYAVDLLRSMYYAGKPEAAHAVLYPVWLNLTIVGVFLILFLVAGTLLFVKKEKNR